jgi:hypothetical protein
MALAMNCDGERPIEIGTGCKLAGLCQVLPALASTQGAGLR